MAFYLFRCETHGSVIVGTPYRCPICDNLFCGTHKADLLKCNHVKYKEPKKRGRKKA